MRTIQTVGLMGVLLTTAFVAGAQTLTTDVGIPLDASVNTGGSEIVIVFTGIEGQVVPSTELGTFKFTTTSPGDLIVVNPTGGNARSNWLADLRFFNPSDPTGSLGLAATEIETFFPGDVGPGGFAGLTLFPHYNLVPATFTIDDGTLFGSETLFGPSEFILAGQTAVIFFGATPAAVPEPGSLALLIGLTTTGAGFLARRRRNHRAA